MFKHKALSRNIALIYQAGKVRLGFLIMACTLAGIAVSPTSPLTAMEIFALAAYVLVASSTSGAFNQWYERDIDAIMDRTKDRPFVTKELEPKNAWNLWLIIISTLHFMRLFKSAILRQRCIFLQEFLLMALFTLFGLSEGRG